MNTRASSNWILAQQRGELPYSSPPPLLSGLLDRLWLSRGGSHHALPPLPTPACFVGWAAWERVCVIQLGQLRTGLEQGAQAKFHPTSLQREVSRELHIILGCWRTVTKAELGGDLMLKFQRLV